MASKDDLSEQLNISTKLASVIERMAASADQLEKSYETQIDSVQKLAQAMGQVNVQGVVQGIEVLNKSLRDMRSNMNDAGKASESSFQKLGKRVEETGKTFKDRFPKAVGVGIAALTGFTQGVRNVVALSKGVSGFFTSFTGGLVDIAAAIIAIPFKIFSGLVDLAEKSAGGTNELAQAIENLRKEFGALSSTTPKTIIDMSKGLSGFSDTGLSAWRVFGNLAQRIEAFTKLAAEMGATFTSLSKEFDSNGGALLAYQKGLGISDEQMKGVAQRALSMGDTIADTFKDTTKYSLELAKAFGLDAKVISRDMAKAFGDVKHFAGATIKEIGEAATYARKLGVELDKITGTLDAFETFDTAAENVAKLSQSFGVTVDAFQLMQAQDPAEQIDILRKSFATAGVDASNFNRQQLKLLASTTGLDEATAKQAFSMKNQGVSLDQVKKKGGEAEKKTLTQADAMGKLADAIERMVQSGGGLSGGFFDNFFKGILGGIQSTKDFYGLMRNIQQALYQVQMIGVKLGRVLPDLIPGFKDMLGGLKDFFNPKTFSKLFEGISQSVRVFFSTDEKYASEKGNIPALVERLHKNIEGFFTVEGVQGKRILEGFKTFFKFAAKVAADGIKWASDKVAEGIRTVVDLIQHPEKLAGIGKAGTSGAGFVASALAPIVEALGHAWKAISPALRDLVMTLGKKLKDYLTSDDFINLVKPALPYVAAVLFGPAFARAMLAAATASIIKATGGMIEGIGKKLVGGLVGKAEQVAASAQKATTGASSKDVQAVGAINKAAGEAIEGGKGWGAKDAAALGLKLVAIATAIAIGGIEIAAALVGMKKILDAGGIKGAQDVVPMLEAMGAMVLSAVPLALALRLVPKGNPLQIAMGGAILSAAVGVVGLVGAGLAWVMKKAATPEQLAGASEMMLKMSLVFLAMTPLILAAAGIGALLAGPQSIILGPAILVGFAALTGAVVVVAATAAGIASQLSKLQVGEGFQPKVDAFLGIMKAIQAFAGALVGLIGLMTPSITELVSGKAESFSTKVNAAAGLIRDMVGRPGSGTGIIGIVETVVAALGSLSIDQGLAEKASVFSSVMLAVSETLKAMTPPDAFFEAGSSFLNKLTDPTYDFTNLTHDINSYANNMRKSVMLMLTGNEEGTGSGNAGVLGIIKQLSSIKIDDAAAASAISSLLGAVASIMKAITPSDDLLKAFSSTSSTSTAWGLFKTNTQKLDTAAISETLKAMADQFGAILPQLTGGALHDVIAMAQGLKPGELKNVEALTNVLSTVSRLTDMAVNISKSTPPGGAVGGAVISALQAVSDMVKQANDLDKALSDGNVNKIDIKAKLDRVARAVGLGGKASYTVNPSKQVQITLNVEVTMDVDKVEKVMIMRKQSIIRDRLNFATDTPGQQGNNTVPQEYQPTLPNVSGGTQ